MTNEPVDLLALRLTEDALGDAIALLTIEITDDQVAARRFARELVNVRDGEDLAVWQSRIVRTLDLTALLGSAAFDLAGRFARDDETTGQTLLQTYAAKLRHTERRRRAIALRSYDPNRRPPGMGNRYCPVCTCIKSGHWHEPNPTCESCDDSTCDCHDENLTEGID